MIRDDSVIFPVSLGIWIVFEIVTVLKLWGKRIPAKGFGIFLGIVVMIASARLWLLCRIYILAPPHYDWTPLEAMFSVVFYPELSIFATIIGRFFPEIFMMYESGARHTGFWVVLVLLYLAGTCIWLSPALVLLAKRKRETENETQPGSRAPDLGFEPPAGYLRMLEIGGIDFHNSLLDPWYFIDADRFAGINDLFQKTWRKRTKTMPWRIVPFARRGDCDDIACFAIRPEKIDILLVHGWTNDGFDVVERYDSFENWEAAARNDADELRKLAETRPENGV